MAFRVEKTGHWDWNGNANVWVVDGFYIQEYQGAGTACVVEGRPFHSTKLTPWGKPATTLWHSKEAAEAICASVNAGGSKEGIDFAMFMDD